MAASRPGAIDGARAHARRSARDIATMLSGALCMASSLTSSSQRGGG